MPESVVVPRKVFQELYAGLVKVEDALATIEELMNREGLERIRKAEGEYRKGHYFVVKDATDIRKLLNDLKL